MPVQHEADRIDSAAVGAAVGTIVLLLTTAWGALWLLLTTVGPFRGEIQDVLPGAVFTVVGVLGLLAVRREARDKSEN